MLPLALFLHRRLRPIKPWLADIGTIGALAYIFVGASGAAILASVGSSLVDAYAIADPAGRVAIATSFDVLRNIVFFGLWQTLDPITSGTWVMSVGWLLISERRLVGRFLVVLGGGLMALSAMTMFGIHSVSVLLAALGLILLVWTVWVIVGRLADCEGRCQRGPQDHGHRC